jgi:cobalamin biosynthesis Mg chelatase CobN
MFPKHKRQTLILSITLFAATNGCDDKATQIAREAADRQAQQNTEMAQLNKEVASGSHQLVEADAKARTEIVGVHHDLQAERERIDTSRSELESERREIAGQRRTESMLIPVSGLLLLVVLLGFCWYALVASRRSENSDAQLTELLIQEIVPNEPSLLSSKLPSLLSHSNPDNRPVE